MIKEQSKEGADALNKISLLIDQKLMYHFLLINIDMPDMNGLQLAT